MSASFQWQLKESRYLLWLRRGIHPRDSYAEGLFSVSCTIGTLASTGEVLHLHEAKTCWKKEVTGLCLSGLYLSLCPFCQSCPLLHCHKVSNFQPPCLSTVWCFCFNTASPIHQSTTDQSPETMSEDKSVLLDVLPLKSVWQWQSWTQHQMNQNLTCVRMCIAVGWRPRG